jgi:hypothetical protein
LLQHRLSRLRSESRLLRCLDYRRPTEQTKR